MISTRYYFRKFWTHYCFGILSLLATLSLSGSIPLQIKGLLDALQATQNTPSVAVFVRPVGVLFLTLGGMFFIRVFSRYAMLGVGYRIEEDIRQKLYAHLLTLPQPFFDAHPSGELMSRLTNDLNAFRMFMGGGLMLFFNVIFAYTIMVGIMWSISWQLTLTAFCLFPLILSQTLSFGKHYKARMIASQTQLGAVSALASENFMGMGAIHGFAAEAAALLRFKDASQLLRIKNLALAKIRVAFMLVVAIMTSLSIWVVVSKGGWEVISGTLTLSSLTAFMLYLERLSWPTITIGWVIASFAQGRASIERINDLLSAPTERGLADNDGVDFVAGDIVVSDLSFQYPQSLRVGAEAIADKVPELQRDTVISNVSFSIPKGAFVLLVGPVASGKSTLLQLLAGRYAIETGVITIGKQPVGAIALQSLRQHVAWMPQSSMLFSMSIYDNLVFGQFHGANTDAERTAVLSLADVTTLSKDIAMFAEGYNTLVGERGVLLSGGQRQRTALTRTLLTAPDVLLLDDPFASVDEPTEAAIIAALDERHLLDNRTTIMATHRLAIAARADQIIVLNEEGQVEAIGAHEDLLAQCNLYRELNKKERLEQLGLAASSVNMPSTQEAR